MASPPPENLVGLIYDERMCAHDTPDGEAHPESPHRIRAIWNKLQANGITERCVVFKPKEAEDRYLASVHSQNHIKLIKDISSKQFDSRRKKTAAKFNSIYFNKGSSEAAYLAAGSVIEVSDKVAKGDISSAIAVVRPPGHHAEHDKPMGFCLFNNVAVAADYLLNEQELGIKKILIVDWDVHHGNGTQNKYYKDPRVLFFSVHRYDFGTFYPAGGDGAYFMTGDGPGAGFNINVPWEHGGYGDADYIAVWDHVLIPVVEIFNPDIILVSAGFDSAIGDPLGGCCITPSGYSVLLKKLMRFAQGKIVMALEGGYNLTSIANSVLACAKVLLQDEISIGHIESQPFQSTCRIIQAVRDELKAYWPVLAAELPQNFLASCIKPFSAERCYSGSDSDVENDESASDTVGVTNFAESVDNVVIVPMSKLNIDENYHGKGVVLSHVQTEESSDVKQEHGDAKLVLQEKIIDDFISWRSLLSKVDVWYASFGSNLWKQRFLCYIEGGKVEGMHSPCCGSLDKSLPKDVIWKVVPHRLFFGMSHTPFWGVGGVAFLDPESSPNEKAYICMYKITLQQFNDVLLQENRVHQENDLHMASPLVDLNILSSIAKGKSLPLEALKDGWYKNVLYLGEEDNLPILTMTCMHSDVEKFKSGELPVTPPAEGYANTLINGLVEGKQLSREEAIEYISYAASQKL